MNVYISVQEKYPTFRVDLTELFFNELSKLGLNITWYMNVGSSVSACPENVILPPFISSKAKVSKLVNKLLYVGADVFNIIKLFFDSKYQLIQVRDKYIAALIALMIAKIKRIPFTYWCSYPIP